MSMNFLEKDLETIIYECDKEKLEERGLCLRGRLLRQLRIGKYGVSDLINVTKQYTDYHNLPYLNIEVIEIKKDKIDISTFLQALGYVKGISRFLHSRGFSRFTLEITLIGKYVVKNDNFIYLTDLFEPQGIPAYGMLNNVTFYTYKYGLEGLEFNQECNYSLVHEGFIADQYKPEF